MVHLKDYTHLLLPSPRLALSGRQTPIARHHQRRPRRSYSSRRRRAAVISACMKEHALATYSPLLFQKKHSLFETCLREVVMHLDEAPFLQSLQVLPGFTFRRQSASPLDAIELDEESDVFILCKSIPQHSAKGHPVLAGKIGDCCEDEKTESSTSAKRHQFWGLVVKSSTYPEIQGCYLMRTTRSGLDGCTCTHFSVTRITSGASLADQYDSVWLI